MSFLWNLPTKVVFGPGSLARLASQPMPGRKALLVISNGTSARRNGSLDSTRAQLEAAGVEVTLFAGIPANPTEGAIMEAVYMARATGSDVIVGLGGGSVLDAVTIIAAVAPQDGRVWDYVQGGTGGRKPLEKPLLPWVAITTSAGTGSEVDRWGVVTNPATREKIGFQGGYADLAIVDPELTLTVPPSYTAYQGFDALFHSVEGYVSRFCNEAAAMVELEAIRSIAAFLPRAVRDGSDLEARTRVSFANTLSGYSMELGSCVSEHSLEHAMSGFHGDLPHGAGLIMISAAYFTKWIEKGACPERFVTMARVMGKADAKEPMDFIAALTNLQEACGVAGLRMSDYGLTPGEFPALAANARATMGKLFECDRFDMTDEDVVDIYTRSWR